MKSRRWLRVRLWVEELEPRVVLSATPSLLHQISNGTIATQSTNWSGYASLPTSGSVTMVSGSWVVPAVTGTTTAYSSFWVGIDGYNSNTVEQIGTDSDIVNGVASYYAWYEMYPDPSFNAPLQLSGKTIAVSAGQTINASVSYTASTKTYTLSLTDASTGASFSTSQKLAHTQNNSAEWIAEAPSSGSGVLPLANFGTASFSNAQATIGTTTGPIDDSAWQNASINMVTGRGNSVLASTSGFTDTTTTPTTSSFTISYSPPPATPTPSPPPGGHHGWGWRGPNGAYLEPVGAGEPMGSTSTGALNFAPAGNGANAGAFAVPQTAPVFQLAASHLDAPALSPVLSALTLNGPRAGSPSDDDMMDNADPVSIWLPAGVSSVRGGGSLAEIATAQRSQPALLTDGAPMQVILGDQARDPFAAPLPAPTPPPVPEQRGDAGDSLVGRSFSKALWLVGAIAFAAHGALVENSRQNDARDEGQEPRTK